MHMTYLSLKKGWGFAGNFSSDLLQKSTEHLSRLTFSLHSGSLYISVIYVLTFPKTN